MHNAPTSPPLPNKDAGTGMTLKGKLIWCGLFAVAMGYFEASIVVYLRALYYPDGFAFPLRDIPLKITLIELGREAASIVMLYAVARLQGRSAMDRFAGFAYCFGVWDIVYYVILKLTLGWPASLGTWDVLFLIPVPWVGPVWAPIGVSVALIAAAVLIWRRQFEGREFQPGKRDWALEILSGLIIIASFPYGAPAAMHKMPLPAYPWYIWAVGMALGLGVFFRRYVLSNGRTLPVL